MVDIQRLIKKGVGEIYVMVSSKENVFLLMKGLDSINFFTNTLGWLARNNYESKRGSMKYLVLNLFSREIAFNRNNPTEELLENKLFVHELDQFTNAGPRIKLKF